ATATRTGGDLPPSIAGRRVAAPAQRISAGAGLRHLGALQRAAAGAARGQPVPGDRIPARRRHHARQPRTAGLDPGPAGAPRVLGVRILRRGHTVRHAIRTHRSAGSGRPLRAPGGNRAVTAAGSSGFEPMSTRLFPKNRGADAYVVNGIAGRCDWVVLSDRQPPQATLVRQVETDSPRHVFVSLREPFQALAFFIEQVLPMIQGPFVLVSGSEDVSLPRQIDQRWRSFDPAERGHVQSLLEDPRLLHWFAENLDQAHPRMSPLPVGLVFPESPAVPHVAVPVIPATGSRPTRVLCAHRVREGAQWDIRREVSALCAGLGSTCTVVREELPEEEFVSLLQAHA